MITPEEKALVAKLRLRMSPSTKKKKERCDRYVWYNKILGIEEPAKPHLLLGSAVHALNERYVPTGIYPEESPAEALRLDEEREWDTYPQGFDALCTSASRIAKGGQHLMMEAREQYVKAPGSVIVEQKVEGMCGPMPYIGHIDLLKDPWDHPRGLDHPAIEDYKTSSNPDKWGYQTPDQVAADPQMLFYGKTYWQDVRGHEGPIIQAHHYFPTKGKGEYRTIRGIAQPEDLQRNWDDFVDAAWDIVDLAKEEDVTKVAANRNSCHMYGSSCPFKAFCPADKGYQPTEPPETSMSMSVADQLAKLQAAAAARQGGTTEPEEAPEPKLTDEQKAELTQKMFALHTNNALSEPALDALLVQAAADPESAAEIRAAAKTLMEQDDGTGRVNPPDSRPTPLTPETNKAAQDEDFEAVVKVIVSLVNDGKEVTVETYDLFAQGKGLDDRKQEVIDTVVARCPNVERSAMGPLFREGLPEDATPEQKFRDAWERADRGDIDLSLETFRTWVKDAAGLERYSRKTALTLVEPMVEAGLLVEDDDGIYHEAPWSPDGEEPQPDEQPLPPEPQPDPLPEGAAGQVTPHPESSIAQKQQAEPARAAPHDPDIHLFMVGCTNSFAMELDQYLDAIQAETHFAEVAKLVKDLDPEQPYWMQPFNGGPKALANMLGGFYDDGKMPLPQALWCAAGHPLADALAHELRRRGVYVIRGLR